MSVFPETGKCYELTHRKTGWGLQEVSSPKYLGKYIKEIIEGPPYDRYMILNFQYENNVDPGGKFRLTTCREEQVFKADPKPSTDPNTSLFTKAVSSSNCFVADKENGKYVCPECKAVEGGSKRIITHNFNCKNKGKEYCQQGAKRSRTKKSKRSKSRSKKARKTLRHHK